MRTVTVEGIIIKRVNVGEADRILTVMTRDLGKVSVKATGVRRITSRRASHVELLNVAKLYLYKGKGMMVLTEVMMVESFEWLKADLRKIGFAYHVCELVNGLCPENQENRLVYDLLKRTFERLTAQDDLAHVAYQFEMELLRLLGYWSSEEELSHQQAVAVIEEILERRLKSRQVIGKMG